MASEAGLVVDPVISGELVDEVHRLVAGRALGGRPLEGGRHCFLPYSVSADNAKAAIEIWRCSTPKLPLSGLVMVIWELGMAWQAQRLVVRCRYSYR